MSTKTDYLPPSAANFLMETTGSNQLTPPLPWPTQKEDMEAASFIISKYTEINEGEPLGFIELIVYKGPKKKVELKTPDWIVELQNYFRSVYGYEQGHAVTSKVLTKFLLRNETIH